ncbi:MAG: hypothetical protein JNM17_28275, partial [Archangium sp.]|nr:hypothetical protein [Archangium sp.]
MWRREFENPPPFRWVTSRDAGISSPLEGEESYQARALLTKTPRFELAPWSSLSIPLEANSEGQLTGPYLARSHRTRSLSPQSPLRPPLDREVQIHREGLIGQLQRRPDGWAIDSSDLLLNGSPSRARLIHGDCLETLDGAGAWVVHFDGCGEADTGWGPLWRAFEQRAISFHETRAGLVVEVHSVAASSLEVLALIRKSALPARLARLILTPTTPEPFETLAAAHRELLRGATFELELRRPQGRDVPLPPKATLAACAVYPDGSDWHHLPLREDAGRWVLDVGPRLTVGFDDARWFAPFFHAERPMLLLPARSALFSGTRTLTEPPTEEAVAVLIDELLELGDPVALQLAEHGEAAAQRLLFPFVSSDPFVGGIEL